MTPLDQANALLKAAEIVDLKTDADAHPFSFTKQSKLEFWSKSRAALLASALLEKHKALEAAEARLSRLSALLDEAEAALEPLAEAGRVKLCGEWHDEQSVQGTDTAFYVRFGALRLAASVAAKIAALKDPADV